MDKKKIYNYLIIIFATVAVLLVVYLIFNKYYSGVVWRKIGNITPQAPQYFSSLDGTVVSSSEMINPSVVGIMIDNHPDARPQSGLVAAKIVYEAPAEGGITRYFAIFDSAQSIEKIGPVRSARPYFVDWLEEYSGLYMHCGGAPEALTKIKSEKVFDADEFFNGPYYWRDESRTAPHNLFTNSERWNKLLSKKSDQKQIFSQGWKFGELNTSSIEMVKSVAINFTADYVVGFDYDPVLKIYTRSINRESQNEDGQPLIAENIIVQYVKVHIIDDYGRKDITTSGSGDLRVLRDGVLMRGQWKKDGQRTRWYDQNGVEINLKPGKIWVEVVPNDINLKIST